MGRLSIALLALAMLSTGCSDTGTSTDGSIFGTFHYTAFNADGSLQNRGTLVFAGNDGEIRGTWSFTDGTAGILQGTVSGDEITVDLHPGYVDANLFLRGRIEVNTFAGRWEEIGFPGVIANGTFIATRR